MAAALERPSLTALGQPGARAVTSSRAFRCASAAAGAALPKPPWLRARPMMSAAVADMAAVLRDHRLHSVCEEAMCPNIGECFAQRTATFMIMGGLCTRRCPFCDVAHGRPEPLDADGRAAGRCGRGARAALRRDHVGRSRRPARRRRRAFRRMHRGGARERAGHWRRSADTGLPRPRGPRARCAVDGLARRVQPQHRDGAVAVSRGAAGRRLSRLARTARAGEAGTAGVGDEIGVDARPWRVR